MRQDYMTQIGQDLPPQGIGKLSVEMAGNNGSDPDDPEIQVSQILILRLYFHFPGIFLSLPNGLFQVSKCIFRSSTFPVFCLFPTPHFSSAVARTILAFYSCWHPFF